MGCVCECVYTETGMYLEVTELLVEITFSPSTCESWGWNSGQIQVTRLGSRHIYLQNHLTGPLKVPFKITFLVD